jgi:hypothetical protein
MYHYCLTVRLLESGTGTSSSILLRFASTRISNQKGAVIGKQSLTKLILGRLVNILGVVSNNGLGNGGTDSVNLSGNSTTLHSDADIEIGKLFLSQKQDWFKDLEAELFRLNKFNGLPIDLDQTAALLRKSNSSRGLFPGMKVMERVYSLGYLMKFMKINTVHSSA